MRDSSLPGDNLHRILDGILEDEGTGYFKGISAYANEIMEEENILNSSMQVEPEASQNRMERKSLRNRVKPNEDSFSEE